MAKIQTRRSISLARPVYDAIAIAASVRGVSMAEYVTDLVRAAGVEIPETVHVTERAARAAIVGRANAMRRRTQGFTVGGVKLAAIEVP